MTPNSGSCLDDFLIPFPLSALPNGVGGHLIVGALRNVCLLAGIASVQLHILALKSLLP